MKFSLKRYQNGRRGGTTDKATGLHLLGPWFESGAGGTPFQSKSSAASHPFRSSPERLLEGCRSRPVIGTGCK